jgi:hypothetical protein
VVKSQDTQLKISVLNKLKFGSSVSPTTFEMLNSHMSSVVTTLDNLKHSSTGEVAQVVERLLASVRP